MSEFAYDVEQFDLLKELIISENNIILFGSGMIGNLIRKYFRISKCTISLIIDNDSTKWRKGRIPVVSPEEGCKRYPQGIYIIANFSHSDEMKMQLRKLGVTDEKIIICRNIALIQTEIEKRMKLQKEDKNFIFDRPREKNIKNSCKLLVSRANAYRYDFRMRMNHPLEENNQKKYEVSVCAIFKDEALYLQEWIEYHKIIGVNHFYLYNNFSQDNYMEVLQPYIQNGEVSLIDWPYKQGQMSAYRDCIEKFRYECQWIGFIDLDEFIVPIDDDNINDFLKRFTKRGSVIIYWKLFGSSGKMDRDLSRLVIEDFTVCWRKHTNIGKCFYNTAFDFMPEYSKNGILHHKMWTNYGGKIFPPVNCFDAVCLDDINIVKGEHFPIQINHYFTKSFREWQMKQSKGDVFFKENPHTEKYFLQHDVKCGAVDVSIFKYLIRLKVNLGRTL